MGEREKREKCEGEGEREREREREGEREREIKIYSWKKISFVSQTMARFMTVNFDFL